jgi:hypothetical protein
MTIASERQFIRKANLVVAAGGKGIDLSDLKFRFRIQSGDVPTPNSADIRVWNLSPTTMKQIRGEFDRVVIQAGYEGSSYGVIFDGTIKQFRIGRESATDVFLDILAAEGDRGYTMGLVCKTFQAGTPLSTMMGTAADAMGVKLTAFPNFVNLSALSRSRVSFGMARSAAQCIADTVGSSWSIQGDEVQVIPLTKYLPGDIVEINSLTGMIGIPEQTEAGVKVRCLLNPKIRIGAAIRLNNGDITQQDIKSIIPFNVRVGTVFTTPLADGADGLYRVLTHDVSGDTRGSEWYSDIVCLAIDPSSAQAPVSAYG